MVFRRLWLHTEDGVEDLAKGSTIHDREYTLAIRSQMESLPRGRGMREGNADHPYPVPHCSILVRFSWSRLLSHASSSCLFRGKQVSMAIALQKHAE